MPDKAPFENRVGLSAARVEQLLALFAPLKRFGETLHDRLLRYVLDGENDEAGLDELAQQTDAAQALSLRCSANMPGEFENAWHTLLEQIEPIDCRFYLRLGKVLEAAARRLPAHRFFCQPAFQRAVWLEILIQEATRTAARVWSSRECKTAVSGPMIEDMIRADGQETDFFVKALFQADRKRWDSRKMRDTVLSLADLGATFASHRDLLAGFLTQGNAESRLLAVENLARAKAPLEPFLEELVACATDSSKRLREAAGPLLRSAGDVALPILHRLIEQGSRTQKVNAARALGRIFGEAERPFLESLLEREKSKPVRDAITMAIRDSEAGTFPPVVNGLQPPLRESIRLDMPVTLDLRECLRKLFDQYNESAKEHNAILANPQSHPRPVFPRKNLPILSDRDLDNTCRALQSGEGCRRHFSRIAGRQDLFRGSAATIQDVFKHPDCALIHAVRFLAMLDYISSPNESQSGMQYAASFYLEIHRQSHSAGTTLEDLAEAIRSLDLPDEILARHVLENHASQSKWEPEAIWPFFLGQLGVLATSLEPAAGDWSARYQRARQCQGAARVLAKFPEVPPPLIGRLWEISVGTNKADRLVMQRITERLPDLYERLAQSLASSAYQTRAVAAEWMGRLGDRRGVTPLHAAARIEKQDAALDAMLTALEKLGEPIESYLNRDKLLDAAEKGLKKGIPSALAWFPWQTLPKVHWRDSGEEVSPLIVTWLLVQNYKLKSAEAGPLLRRYCDLMDPAERGALGDFVLSAWLERDQTLKYTETEARVKARQQATGYVSGASCSPEIEDWFYRQALSDTVSAVSEKGILAIAAACCGVSAVAPVQAYLAQWYGYRAAQCRALIAMLSGIEQPAAIQYLLSISHRFRTKSIREEAERCVRLLADRKGWTLDELADRTMPTAGFDEEGKLVLSYGAREFIVRVNAELQPVLSDTDGKTLKSLPAPRKDDDEEHVKTAKKSFATAKKELKKFTDQQTTRLYEAMCTQRTWSGTDWRTWIFSHPLLRRVCPRLIWAVYEDNAPKQTFRPLDDGTLTGPNEQEFFLADDASVRILHGSQVSPEAAAVWTVHLADYAVAALFAQFGRQPYGLPEDRQSATAISDFQGHMVESFRLRGTATKLGYTRGPTQDGGWFDEYLKRFPGLELEVHLEFSGNGLPEENRLVALTTLSFHRTSNPSDDTLQHGAAVPLGEIPPVLLTECYNDLRAIAAGGKGFDPEWEKKVR